MKRRTDSERPTRRRDRTPRPDRRGQRVRSDLSSASSGDRLHGIVEATDPDLAVSRRALRIEVVNEVMAEFMGDGSQHRCMTKANLPMLGDRALTVGFPSRDTLLTVGFDDHRTRWPALTGVGPATSAEGQIGHRDTELLRDRANECLGLAPIDGVPVAESGDEFIIAAERPHPVFVARYSIRSLDCSEVHLTTPSLPSLFDHRFGGQRLWRIRGRERFLVRFTQV